MGRRKEAIHYTALHAMRRNVMALANKTAAIHPIHLTHDDVLHLTTPEEHHDTLRKAASVALVSYDEEFFQIAVPTAKYGILAIHFAMLNVDDTFAPLPPRFPSYIVATPQGEDAREKLHKWIEWKAEVGREFGIVNYALSVLASKCSRPEEVRFLFPSILALCAPQGDEEENAHLKAFHERVQDFVAPRHLPALSQPEKMLIREAAGYLSAASILPSKVTSDEETKPEVSVAIGDMPNFDYHGITIGRMHTN